MGSSVPARTHANLSGQGFRMLEPAQSATPPTEQGFFVPPKAPPVWPSAVGVVSIILGALGLLGNAWQVASVFLLKLALGSAAAGNSQTQIMFQVQSDHAPLAIAAGLIGLVASALLITTGAGLCGRRRWGVKIAKIWIAVKVIAAAASAVQQALFFQAVSRALAAQGSSRSGAGFDLAWLCIGLLIALAFPVFMLIWLGRDKVRRDIGDFS